MGSQPGRKVYVPAAKPRYGYYVLPVLYGDRLDPGFDRAGNVFTMKNWWWENGVDEKDDAMLAALRGCVKDFTPCSRVLELLVKSKVGRVSGPPASAS